MTNKFWTVFLFVKVYEKRYPSAGIVPAAAFVTRLRTASIEINHALNVYRETSGFEVGLFNRKKRLLNPNLFTDIKVQEARRFR